MPKSRVLTPEHLAEVGRLYTTDVSREAILEWLRARGYGHGWDSIQHTASNHGWQGRSRGPKTGTKTPRNLGPFFSESELGTP